MSDDCIKCTQFRAAQAGVYSFVSFLRNGHLIHSESVSFEGFALMHSAPRGGIFANSTAIDTENVKSTSRVHHKVGSRSVGHCGFVDSRLITRARFARFNFHFAGAAELAPDRGFRIPISHGLSNLTPFERLSEPSLPYAANGAGFQACRRISNHDACTYITPGAVPGERLTSGAVSDRSMLVDNHLRRRRSSTADNCSSPSPAHA